MDLANDRPKGDGVVRGWFDGRLVIDHTDVVIRSTDFPNMKFHHFLMAPYWDDYIRGPLGPGDCENAEAPAVTVKAGERIDGGSIDCDREIAR